MSKYQEFHSALMNLRGTLSKTKLLKVAESLGIKAKAIERKLETDEVGEILRKNYKLAQALDISGTPAFIIGDQVISGAIDLATMKRLIRKAKK